jgi:hypothetical protein
MHSDRPKTAEYFQHIFMEEGFDSMVKAIKDLFNEAHNPLSSNVLNGWIRAILYGYNSDGTVKVRPSQEDLHDITKNPRKYKLNKMVWSMWIRQRNKER